ncbi:Hsp20/alpha crystallin family protein [Intrasporangium sp. DVR]|uniref:Hsp20/alpha crystallin family protein n=1 Tax=Intrasporangium sp. DVR TaxID=3127867 RepID=UPI00313A703D
MTSIATRPTHPFAEVLDWFENGLNLRGMGLSPYLHVEDFVEDDAYVVRAEMPGVDPDRDVRVAIEGDVLTITGERREEKREKNRSEMHYGSFTRSIRLPHEVSAEDVNATYVDGVLEIRVPVGAPERPTRRIPVTRKE